MFRMLLANFFSQFSIFFKFLIRKHLATDLPDSEQWCSLSRRFRFSGLEETQRANKNSKIISFFEHDRFVVIKFYRGLPLKHDHQICPPGTKQLLFYSNIRIAMITEWLIACTQKRTKGLDSCVCIIRLTHSLSEHYGNIRLYVNIIASALTVHLSSDPKLTCWFIILGHY